MHEKNVGKLFLGTHTFQKVPQHVWMGHCWLYLCVNGYLEIVVQFSNLMCKL